MSFTKQITTACALVLSAGLYAGQADFADYFGNHMVLQRDTTCPIWGYGDPNTEVMLTLNGKKVGTTNVDETGYWRINLEPTSVGGPYDLTLFTDDSCEKLENVMFGDVYLCSGQSNMEFSLRIAAEAKEFISSANIPNLRLLQVENAWSGDPQKGFKGEWTVSNPDAASAFSAVAFIAGKKLAEELDIPIGLVQADWGGTPIEAWMSIPALIDTKDINGYFGIVVQYYDKNGELYRKMLSENIERYTNYAESLKQAEKNGTVPLRPPVFSAELDAPTGMGQGAVHYNAMINPLTPAAFKGVFWYQGCSNVARRTEKYGELLKRFTQDWRENFESPDLPFIIVQICPYDYEADYNLQPVDEYFEKGVYSQQTYAESDDNAYLVVTNDVGNVKDIHPTRKKPVGERIANLCKKHLYGQEDIIADSPVCEKIERNGNELVLYFKNSGEGLTTSDEQSPDWFKIAGANGLYLPAQARIDGDKVILTNESIERPCAVTFAWSDKAEPNLRNSAGLPAGSFKIDVPAGGALYDNVPEAENFEVIYKVVPTKNEPADAIKSIKYDVDNSKNFANRKIKRIGYYFETVRQDFTTEYVFVSMDPFTNDLTKLGVPTPNSNIFFQQEIDNLEIYSNSPNLSTGKFDKGVIEFWPFAFDPKRKLNIDSASDEVYDWDDTPQTYNTGYYYGSMQLHNISQPKGEVIFAFNRFFGGKEAEFGIGTNQGAGNPDYVDSKSGKEYKQVNIIALVEFDEE